MKLASIFSTANESIFAVTAKITINERNNIKLT